MNLKNKTVLITGGNSGLGFAIAKELVKKNSKIIILGKDKKGVEMARKKLNSPLISTIVCDLRDYKDIQKKLKNIRHLDILINNAGVWLEGQLQNNKFLDIANVININLTGLICITKIILPIMLKKNHGIIFNISSTSGINPKTNQSIYIASKYGVTGFTKSLQKDLENTNIKVFGFYPGGMKTNLFNKTNSKKDVSNFMDPQQIAKIIVFILQRPQSVNMDHVVINRSKVNKVN
ncbi:hypothetical protein A3J78_01505 [Candidatus Beckwithbacteria bacterium RBG_13_35_6]|uniref:Short-chain dehydrogenase n=1 Tax=Candidatus Beckwithbacteria bacterium RBG_13_35_6 TaxID=1797456 RepID=A0A1F5DHR9_9BACT|nr:MAG: hypothetical protein A3J78_01505 [Candidatus Beckwithbacteria bacterium RBG_13_35_6]